MCSKCGYIGIEKRIDIPGALKKSLLLHDVGTVLLVLFVPSLIGLVDFVIKGHSPYWLLLLLLHFAAICLAKRISNQVKTADYFCANCGAPYDK